jgi:hypothetical protein
MVSLPMNMPGCQPGHVQEVEANGPYHVEESEVSIVCIGTLRRLFVGRRVMSQAEFKQLPEHIRGSGGRYVGFVRRSWGHRLDNEEEHLVFLKNGRLYRRCVNWMDDPTRVEDQLVISS